MRISDILAAFIKNLPGFVIIVLLAILPGCITVESYEKMYINDRDMELQASDIQVFELDFQSYREGASGGNGSKTGGGCGCN